MRKKNKNVSNENQRQNLCNNQKHQVKGVGELSQQPSPETKTM